MRKDLKVVFKEDLKRIKGMKGSEKNAAIKELNEKLDVYMTAKDFSFYYPQIYTPSVLSRIANARNNIEACNIMTSLRRAMPC